MGVGDAGISAARDEIVEKSDDGRTPIPGHRHAPGRGVADDERLQGGWREEPVGHGVGLEGKHQGRRGLPPDLLSQLAGQRHLTDSQVPPLGGGPALAQRCRIADPFQMASDLYAAQRTCKQSRYFAIGPGT